MTTAKRKAAPRPTAGRVTPRKPAPVEEPTPGPPPGKLALLKVLVQPVLVLVGEDGQCHEVRHDAFEIKGADWSKWRASAFDAAALEKIRQGLTIQ